MSKVQEPKSKWWNKSKVQMVENVQSPNGRECPKHKNQSPNVTEQIKRKYFELEERTMLFALECRRFTEVLKKSIANHEYAKQLVRSSGSQAANYIEANESVSQRDFQYRIRICRKETKESGLWLKLFNVDGEISLITWRDKLIDETIQLRKIFTSILARTIS